MQKFQAVGALIHLSGELQFVNNSGGEECALHMQSFAQVVLKKGLRILFEGNSGRSGQLCFMYTNKSLEIGEFQLEV